MSTENPETSLNKNKSRPVWLSVLCILTFLGSGLQSFVFLIITMTYTEFMAQVSTIELPIPEMKIFFTGTKAFYLTGFLLLLFSTFGASLMWKLRKTGFHFYTGSQLLFLALPMIYLEGFQLSVIDIALTGTFILLYLRFYKIMY